MPYTADIFRFNITSSGFYSVANDILLPTFSENVNAIVYPTPMLATSIVQFPPSMINQSVQARPKYDNFARIDLISAGIFFVDSFNIEFAIQFLNKGRADYNFADFQRTGEIQITEIQVQLNYTPSRIELLFINFRFINP